MENLTDGNKFNVLAGKEGEKQQGKTKEGNGKLQGGGGATTKTWVLKTFHNQQKKNDQKKHKDEGKQSANLPEKPSPNCSKSD